MILSTELRRLQAFTPAELSDSSKCMVGAHKAAIEIGGSLACIEGSTLLIDTPRIRRTLGAVVVAEDFSATCRIDSVYSMQVSDGNNMLALHSFVLHELNFNLVDIEHPVRAAEHIVDAAIIRSGAVYIPVAGLRYYAPVERNRVMAW